MKCCCWCWCCSLLFPFVECKMGLTTVPSLNKVHDTLILLPLPEPRMHLFSTTELRRGLTLNRRHSDGPSRCPALWSLIVDAVVFVIEFVRMRTPIGSDTSESSMKSSAGIVAITLPSSTRSSVVGRCTCIVRSAVRLLNVAISSVLWIGLLAMAVRRALWPLSSSDMSTHDVHEARTLVRCCVSPHDGRMCTDSQRESGASGIQPWCSRYTHGSMRTNHTRHVGAAIARSDTARYEKTWSMRWFGSVLLMLRKRLRRRRPSSIQSVRRYPRRIPSTTVSDDDVGRSGVARCCDDADDWVRMLSGLREMTRSSVGGVSIAKSFSSSSSSNASR
eukprot:PhM_4_TR471/c1_g3_i1/m.27515